MLKASDMLRAIDELLEKLDAEQTDIQKRSEQIANQREQLEELRRALGGVTDDVAALLFEQASEQRTTHFEKIVAYLKSQNNKPHAIGDLERATGIPKSSISAVLYRTHREHFELKEFDDKPNLWRLKIAKPPPAPPPAPKPPPQLRQAPKPAVPTQEYDEPLTAADGEIPF